LYKLIDTTKNCETQIWLYRDHIRYSSVQLSNLSHTLLVTDIALHFLRGSDKKPTPDAFLASNVLLSACPFIKYIKAKEY